MTFIVNRMTHYIKSYHGEIIIYNIKDQKKTPTKSLNQNQ